MQDDCVQKSEGNHTKKTHTQNAAEISRRIHHVRSVK